MGYSYSSSCITTAEPETQALIDYHYFLDLEQDMLSAVHLINHEYTLNGVLSNIEILRHLAPENTIASDLVYKYDILAKALTTDQKRGECFQQCVLKIKSYNRNYNNAIETCLPTRTHS